MSIKEHVPTPNGLPLMLLACPGPRMAREFQYSIFDEDYSYFSNKSKEVLQGELLYFSYHTFRASTVITFEVTGQGGVFLLDHLHMGN